jgi:hypothetical protein
VTYAPIATKPMYAKFKIPVSPYWMFNPIARMK